MKIVFMGTPDFAAGSLKALIGNHDVAAVFTQPDRPKGRGQKVQYNQVKSLALEHGIPVYQPIRIKKEPEAVNAIRDIQPDIIVVVAFGQIIPKEVLDMPRFGCVNVHASLLPELRGAAPINWAIVRGYNKTGVTTMLMNEGIDTGDMLLKSDVEIREDETAEELHDELMKIGAELLLETLDGLEKGNITPEKQDDSKSNYAPMLSKELGHIDWNKDCKSVHNLIRGVTPWPGAYCYYEDKMIKIWKAKVFSENKSKTPGEIISVSKEGIEVACGVGSILIMELQEVGSKRMDINSYLNGHTISEGSLLK